MSKAFEHSCVLPINELSHELNGLPPHQLRVGAFICKENMNPPRFYHDMETGGIIRLQRAAFIMASTDESASAPNNAEAAKNALSMLSSQLMSGQAATRATEYQIPEFEIYTDFQVASSIVSV